MTPEEIREMADCGDISPEEAARWMERIHHFRRIGRRARLRRWASNILLAPLRWLGLTRLR